MDNANQQISSKTRVKLVLVKTKFEVSMYLRKLRVGNERILMNLVQLKMYEVLAIFEISLTNNGFKTKINITLEDVSVTRI